MRVRRALLYALPMAQVQGDIVVRSVDPLTIEADPGDRAASLASANEQIPPFSRERHIESGLNLR